MNRSLMFLAIVAEAELQGPAGTKVLADVPSNGKPAVSARFTLK